MKPWPTFGIRGGEDDVLLTQVMPSGRSDYAIAEAMQIVGFSFCPAVGHDFEEEG